jgi:hypothetical protein
MGENSPNLVTLILSLKVLLSLARLDNNVPAAKSVNPPDMLAIVILRLSFLYPEINFNVGKTRLLL